MRLSVVLLCYNQAQLLPRSLGALQAQAELIDEIYLIDNASSDHSLAQLQAAAAAFRSAHVVANTGNLGAVAALNAALAQASGHLIYCAAADDFILPGFLQHHLDMFSRYPDIGLSSGLSRLADSGGDDLGVFPSPMPRLTSGELSARECRDALFRLDHWFMGNATVFSREKLLALGGFNPEYAGFSDAVCCFSLALRHGAAFTPRALAVKHEIEAGMGSAVHTEAAAAAALWARVERDMTQQHPDLYDAALVARMRQRWRFNTARAQLLRHLQPWPGGPVAQLAFAVGRAVLLLRHKPFDLITVTTRRSRVRSVAKLKNA